MKPSFCMALVGPTASGKTGFALSIAKELKGEIICMDSTTVYKGFDIGSGKPTPSEQTSIAHHLLDVLEPDAPFSAHHFVEKAEQAIQKIEQKKRLPIIVGGTYFYLRALQHGMYDIPALPDSLIESIEKKYTENESLNTVKMHEDLKSKDPKAAEKIHPNDRYRCLRALAILEATGELPSKLKASPLNESQQKRIWLKYALILPRDLLYQNIALRTEEMLKQGLIEETRKILSQYPKARALNSIGYSECRRHLEGQLTKEQLKSEIIEKTRQLAKRQFTWLRSDPELKFIDNRDIPRIRLEYENLLCALGKGS